MSCEGLWWGRRSALACKWCKASESAERPFFDDGRNQDKKGEVRGRGAAPNERNRVREYMRESGKSELRQDLCELESIERGRDTSCPLFPPLKFKRRTARL